MFYVFSTNGKLFGGPLEKLYQINKTDETTAALASDFANSSIHLSQGNDTDELVSHSAIDRYKATLPEKNQRELIYHVYQVMTKPVKVLELSASLDSIHQAFKQYQFSAFPVVNANQQLHSLIQRHKFTEYLLDLPSPKFHRLTLNDTPELLEPEVISTAPVTDVRRAAQIMIERQTPSLPVVEPNGGVLGIVTKRDILSCLAKDPPLSLWC
ncbi:CBS domain-containing protein [Neiella sp. HB171785]|uniref:CBS domain-containing protein n=1 Tax=Neiella litorisoli TaxID=2771431 RepID=A0A8J6UGA6_9GAMM|nr:CBS domain-containing protein [Neiella litorisoli]MBD1389776.1 CBS domain-containing protein [Neiella litorisoli]